jgi:class 3 adenylate cyclase
MARALQAETRKLSAIMFTDMVGFSRQMGSDETRMLRLLDTHNQIIQTAVAAHHDMVIKTVGDAFLLDFPSPGRWVGESSGGAKTGAAPEAFGLQPSA